MQTKAQVTIRGAKLFVGTMDDGKKIDSGKIFVDTDLAGSEKGTGWGICTSELKCRDSAVVETINKNPFPFTAELEITVETNGKVMTQVIEKITPLQRVVEKTPAKAA